MFFLEFWLCFKCWVLFRTIGFDYGAMAAQGGHGGHGHGAWDEPELKDVKPEPAGCCFWFKMFPPFKWFCQFMKWLFLSRMEYKVGVHWSLLRSWDALKTSVFFQRFSWCFCMFSSESHVLEVLKMAKKLYEVVNCQSGCCTDCPYRHLSKMERMYLHRILKDQTRWQYLTLPIQHTFSICFSFFLYKQQIWSKEVQFERLRQRGLSFGGTKPVPSSACSSRRSSQCNTRAPKEAKPLQSPSSATQCSTRWRTTCKTSWASRVAKI